MRSEQDARRAIDLYADMIRRICFLHLKSYSDTEDIFQNVFLKYVLRTAPFNCVEHEKAWLIRVTINECTNLLKSFAHSKTVPIEELIEQAAPQESGNQVLEAVLKLPKKYKDVVYLFYYEGYTAVEIATILNKNTNTIYTLLSRGRAILKEELGGEDFE